MEAASLYTFAAVKNVQVLCVAHVTNSMGQCEGDFEKGTSDGADDALNLLEALVDTLSDL